MKSVSSFVLWKAEEKEAKLSRRDNIDFQHNDAG
jgi:hypothetical protein